MQRMRCSLLAAGWLVALAAVGAGAQEVRTVGPVTITLRGFVSASMLVQDASFGHGNGQNAVWVAAPEPGDDPWLLTGDVRNTRLHLGLGGPEIAAGWRPSGALEFDLFGGFPGPAPVGAFTDEQPLLRLRLAYADLTREGTTLRVGQAWSPLFGYAPVSLTHLGVPLGQGGAGVVGWRFPGIFLYQTLTGADAPVRAQLQLAAMRGSWIGLAEDVVQHRSPGEAAMLPQVQGRLDLSGEVPGTLTWGAYLVGHYDRKDLSGVGDPADDRLDGTAVAAGARLMPAAFPLTLHGNIYRGRAIGQQLGQITQFGDIGGWGGWIQAGYNITPDLSAWAFYGTDRPDDDEVRTAVTGNARLHNENVAALLRYTMGPYALGLEYLHAITDWRMGPLLGDVRRTGNQVAFSVLLNF